MVDAVLHLSSITVVLPLDAGRVPTTLGNARLVNAADRLGAGVLLGNHLLASISQLLLVPHNRFQEPLQCPRSHPLIQGDRLGVLPPDVRQQTLHVDLQQIATSRPGKTICETRQKSDKHSSEICDILNLHGAALRGFRVKRLDTRRVASLLLLSQDQ